jgi:Ala-tRNA(Pro) deacylase
MPLTQLRQFLDSQQVPYVVVSHSVAYTAQGIAALTHIPGSQLAKTVIVKVDGALAMAVVPAPYHVDLKQIKISLHAKSVEIASEAEFKSCFPDCETGAMPPFGNLYKMAVLADESLSRQKEIAFNAGSHRELVRMAWKDFETVVKPNLIKLALGKIDAKAA